MNKPDILNGDLWIYAIHSKKAEMIRALEDNGIVPKDRTYESCLIESIKCNHNEISNYIRDFLFDKSKSNENRNNDKFELNKSPVLYHNFEFIPDDFESIFKLIFHLKQNEYSSLVKLVNDQTQFFFDTNDYIAIKPAKSICMKYLVQQKSTKKKFMITSYDFKDCINEISRMMMCRYPSILNIKGFSPVDPDNENNESILTDYYEMTLFDYINKKRCRRDNHTKTNDYIIFLGIAIGLRSLHKNGIIHELLCPGSILLDENLYPIIQKVEITKRLIFILDIQFKPEFIDSTYYMPPEQTEDDECQKSNVFSYSFILFNLITFVNPFEDFKRRISSFQALNKVNQGYRPSYRHIEYEYINKFLEKCWCQDPDERLSFDEILNIITEEEFHSYFEPLDHQKVMKYLDEYGNEFDEIKKKFE